MTKRGTRSPEPDKGRVSDTEFQDPIDRDADGREENPNEAAQQGWLAWLTKGSITPMMAAILSCTFEAMNSESDRGFPMVKLRRRSNSMFSLSPSYP